MSVMGFQKKFGWGVCGVIFFFQYCAGQRFIAALSHTGGQARKNVSNYI